MKELLRDSPLTSQIRALLARNEGGDQTQWTFYGSPLKEYEETFKGVLPDTSIISFVLGKTSPVVLDFMSPSKALRDLFRKVQDEDKVGIAISLSDRRSRKIKKADERLGIHQVAGNVIRSSTWDEIDSKLKNRKADLIMERGELGLIYIPPHPKFYAIMVNKMWNLLSSYSGMLLLQVPYSDAVISWVDYLNSQNIKAYFSFSGGSGLFPSLRIDKNLNSPSKLPFLWGD